MAIVPSSKQLNGSHWYTQDGKPFHHIEENGKVRVTTLRDARKYNLYPSVTSILNVLSKPGLEKWKLRQVTDVAFNNPSVQLEEKTADSYNAKVVGMAFLKVHDAANLGKRIHHELDACTQGKECTDNEIAKYIQGFLDWQKDKDIKFTDTEVVVVNKEHGFAGRVDTFFQYGKDGIGILDYKTRKFAKGEKPATYDNEALQLAAYAASYYGEDRLSSVLAGNAYISSTSPGALFHIYKHNRLQEDWEAFKALCGVWRYQMKYDPRKSKPLSMSI
jgi:hypothetical protein